MADKWQAIQSFWGGFGIPAYDESSVPDGASLPYITYNASVGDFEMVVQLTGSVWYFGTSWAEISAKVDEIARAVVMGKIVKLDGGYMYICKGSPFAQRMPDDNDHIKRVYIVMQAEFFTEY